MLMKGTEHAGPQKFASSDTEHDGDLVIWTCYFLELRNVSVCSLVTAVFTYQDESPKKRQKALWEVVQEAYEQILRFV